MRLPGAPRLGAVTGTVGRTASIGGPGSASGTLPSLPLACMAGRSGISPLGAGDAPPTGVGV
eukprot:8098801-Alexandrium_andersonii.AAC.1